MESLRVTGTLDSLSVIGEYIMKAANLAGLSKRKAYRLRLAVDEIATNAIVHGYMDASEEGDLIIRAAIDDTTLTITLEDSGPPYDARQTPPPSGMEAPLSERETGGLGVFLALQGVDQFDYERAGEWNRNIFVVKREESAS
ncbi:MAG: ATP-binding protein [Ardenticatenaceae bacterium]